MTTDFLLSFYLILGWKSHRLIVAVGEGTNKPTGRICMFGGRLGIMELVIILVIIFFLFGAKRLPEIGKGIGEGIKNFKGAMKNEEEKDKPKN
jgi:sec-independent protein translocase protein TatA